MDKVEFWETVVYREAPNYRLWAEFSSEARQSKRTYAYQLLEHHHEAELSVSAVNGFASLEEAKENAAREAERSLPPTGSKRDAHKRSFMTVPTSA